MGEKAAEEQIEEQTRLLDAQSGKRMAQLRKENRDLTAKATQLEADLAQAHKELVRVKSEISGKLVKWNNHYSLTDSGSRSPAVGGMSAMSPTSPSRSRAGVNVMESRLGAGGGRLS